MADASDRGSDDAALAGYARALADAVEAALPAWVVRCVEERLRAHRGEVEPEVRASAVAAGARARDAVMPRLRALLETDVDEQWTGPLAVIRPAVAFPTEVLRDAGVPPVARDEAAEALFPDDVYDLTPATFGDLDPSVHEPGLMWGAAKAHVVLARRRAEGKR